MFERPDVGERAILVDVRLAQPRYEGDPAEFRELAISANVQLVAELSSHRERPDPKFLLGEGKVTELKSLVISAAADVVLVDGTLSPAQERNLEGEINCRVIDRTRVILDIFAQRARSFEGKLQVEMAQLKHLSTRLVRGWTHLERQKGGIGLRGPGETQLESDRRLIGKRIQVLAQRLKKLQQQRRQGSRARARASLSTVALVGYTNAGKSTLFNLLTQAKAYAADQLFATLDTTLRRMAVPGEKPVLLSDTVGFIGNLPPELIAAFHATLEETTEAALLLHVIDASDEEMGARRGDVEDVLSRLGAGATPVLEVYNKIDCLVSNAPRVERDPSGQVRRVWLSARTGAGVNLLVDAIAEQLSTAKTRRWVRLPPQAGRLRAQLYRIGAVRDEMSTDDGGYALEITIEDGRWERLRERAQVVATDVPMPELESLFEQRTTSN